MTHADDDGLVCPPRLAPAARRDHAGRSQKPEDRERVLDVLQGAQEGARGADATPARRCACSSTTATCAAATKAWQWIKKGVPIRLEIGPRDIEKDTRLHGPPRQGRRRRRPAMPRGELVAKIGGDPRGDPGRAVRARARVPQRAHARDRHEGRVLRVLRRPPKKKANDPTPIHGGFALDALQRRPGARGARSRTTSRSPCAASRSRRGEPGTCPFTGQPSTQRVVWAKSY